MLVHYYLCLVFATFDRCECNFKRFLFPRSEKLYFIEGEHDIAVHKKKKNKLREHIKMVVFFTRGRIIRLDELGQTFAVRMVIRL